jgi:hypothetical protein
MRIRTGTRGGTTYEIVDSLHTRRVVGVTGEDIAATVSGWLAELGAASPLADKLAAAARCGDWSRVHVLEDELSVRVMVVR